jgi:hypothetical protein
LLIDLCSTVAPHNFASNNDTTHWDDICKDTFAFLLPLCAKHRLKLLIQSGDMRQQLSDLYSAHGLKEHRLPPGPASVMRRFTLPIEVPSISKEAVQLAVHAVGHPSGFLTYADTIVITRSEVCTPRPRGLRARPSLCSGPRRAEPRVFVQAELLQELLPVELRGMFASVLDTQLREWWGDVVRELASQQPENHLSLLELLRSEPDGLKQLLEMPESKFSAVDSDAIRKALEHSNHRRNVATQSLKLALTREAVSEALNNGTGAPVILRLPDSVQEWKLAAILRKLRASHVIAWPAEPTEAWLKQLVEQVLRFMFRSEGGTLGGAAACSRSPARI